jgi:GH25 family lysozyme M1 (1,4-beta-N-acetylmuramidase)/murein DD-endopeptidase MepM/ murein hydrolase activator NlpD/uncharacterized protein YozE (UPF0346 family)
MRKDNAFGSRGQLRFPTLPHVRSLILISFLLHLALGAVAHGLNPPAIQSPGSTSSPGPTESDLTPTFTWSSVSGATGYGLYIRDVTANTLVYNNPGGPKTGTSFTLPSGYLSNNGHAYRWAMTTFSGGSEGAQSSYRYFQTPAATLGPPSIQSPGSSSSPGPTESDLTPTFTWNLVSGASGYGLYIRDVTANSLIYENVGGPKTGTSFTLPSGYLSNNGHAYRWAMTSFNGATEGSQSGYRYFQTPTTAFNPPSIVSPGSTSSPGPTESDLTPTFTWNSVSGASGYGLYIRDVTADTLVYDNVGGPKTGTSFTLPSGYLSNNGHAYRWAMTSFNGTTEGSQSGYRYFQTPTAALNPPSIVSPGGTSSPGPTESDLTPTFTWNSVSGASGYGLYIRDVTADTLVYDNVGGAKTGTSVRLRGGYLSNNGHAYRWAMTSFNGATEGAQSGYRYFQTPATTLSPPSIQSPGSTLSPGPTEPDLTPTFTWNSMSGASGYGLYIRDVTTNTLIYENVGGPKTGTSFTLPSGYLSNNGHAYRWAMTSFNGATEGAQSGYRYFQTPTTAVGPPSIQSPGSTSSPGPTESDLTPTFTWSSVAGASGYGLYIRDVTTDTLIYNNVGGPKTGTSFTLPAGYLADNGHSYRWAMTSFSGSAESAQSGYRYFQTSSSSGVFRLGFPLAGLSPYSASISSVFDHSMTAQFTPGGGVVAFTGEQGTVVDANEPPATGSNGALLYSYKKQNGGAFLVNGHYVGTATGSGTLNYDGHPGYDYPTVVGTNVYAAEAGWVEAANTNANDPGGRYIRIQHDPHGYQTQYLHLDSLNVSLGATITRGQLIGKSGNTGASTGPHLHFEVKKLVGGAWKAVDPYGWTGSGSDPYSVTTNVQLWGDDAPGAIQLGIDVSHYQNDVGPINWAAVHSSGRRFAFVKASESYDVPDNYTTTNLQGAAGAGLLVGGYHLLRPDFPKFPSDWTGSAVAEADYFLSRLGSYSNTGNLPPVLDLEGSYGLSASALQQYVAAWLERVNAQTGRTPIIYTTRSVAVFLNLSVDFAEYPLWIATDDGDSVGVPEYLGNTWPGWRFKQYRFGENGGTCPGVTGPVDLDSFNGDHGALVSLAGENPSDVVAPLISSLSITPTSLAVGSSFTVSYTVSDQGGSGLKKVVLRRTSGDGSQSDPGWQDIKTNLLAGDGPVSGSFTDAPCVSGTCWYGIAVFDQANNSKDERQANLGPIKRTVTPRITVTSPAGGEVWQAGTVQNITWTSQGVSGNVRLILSVNGYPQSPDISTSTANDGTFSWTIPQNQTPGSSYEIAVQSVAGGGFDLSDGQFTISPASDGSNPSVTITSPTGSSSYQSATASLNIAGTASDNLAVAEVRWTNNRGGSGLAAGTSNWAANGIALAAGANVITVTAKDASGNIGTDSVLVTFGSNDSTRPSITIASPTSASNYLTSTGVVTLGGNAADDVGITQVEWSNSRGGSGVASGTDSWAVPEISLSSGQNVISVVATDQAGNSRAATLAVTYTPPGEPLWSGPVVPSAVNLSGNRYFAISFDRLIGTDSNLIRVQGSSDLGVWHDATAAMIQVGEPVLLGEGLRERVTMRCPFPIGDPNAADLRFLRLSD